MMPNVHLIVAILGECGLMGQTLDELTQSEEKYQRRLFLSLQMHKFKVPIEKDTLFARGFFELISEHVSNLATENEKVPNKIIFTGPIGNELLVYIREKGWNFKGFDLDGMGGVLNSIVFKYCAPLTIEDARHSTLFDRGTLNDKQINGIPGPETIQKIISSYSAPAYTIERTIRPEIRILLHR